MTAQTAAANADQYQHLEPLNQLDAGRMQDLLSTASTDQVARRQCLQSVQERNWYVYLLQGQMSLRAAHTHKVERICADSKRAQLPVFSHPSLSASAVVIEAGHVLRVDRTRFEQLCKEQSAGSIEVADYNVAGLEADVIRRVFEDYQSGSIPVPSMPETALKIRQLLDDPDVGLEDLTQCIEGDPPIAGKLVAAANSALVRGSMSVCTVHEALVRLGLQSACSLVTSLAMKELFQFRQAELRTVATKVWRHSVLVAAYARLLAGRQSSMQYATDKAFMIGLLHQIGSVSLLSYFDALPASVSDTAVIGTLKKLGPMVSSLVLQKWGMDADFVDAAERASKWQQEEDKPRSPYVDLVGLAKHQALATRDGPDCVPAVSELPALAVLAPDSEVGEQGVFDFLANSSEVEALTEFLN